MVLLDRCVPPGVGAALNHFDIDFKTLADIYGRDGAQSVADVDWIRDSAAQGWLALTQNFKIPRVAHEAAAIREHSARILCYHKANLTREAKGLILGRHLRALGQLVDHSSAAFWRIAPRGIHRDI
ncbi:PIN-like domain-containing protein [Mycolicibacterium mageritense]|uniref:VapC45 PIN like domain-containing protein n=1 Tax=Mycolicibacterium mageritense TaxID=53462 RepID=A0AAI8TZP3_MYCME|nr:hypothetical protein [Mycolicibacterium mageritense]BDY31445.1 hypothetical protein hbim_05397 [Mycolicibacterium mageritense]